MDLSTTKVVLDVAYGPDGWAREVAQANPWMQVIGIDLHPSMIRYAQAFAQVQRLENLSFSVMDALHPLAFAGASFDGVNARFLMGFLFRGHLVGPGARSGTRGRVLGVDSPDGSR